jgi:hypothetical protein
MKLVLLGAPDKNMLVCFCRLWVDHKYLPDNRLALVFRTLVSGLRIGKDS